MMLKSQTTTLAATLAPEDITPGIYVTTLYETVRTVLTASQDNPRLPEGTTVFTARLLPDDAGEPKRVVGVCWPFLMVESAGGDVTTVDTRQAVLARLSDRFGREYFSRNAPKRSESSTDGDDSDGCV